MRSRLDQNGGKYAEIMHKMREMRKMRGNAEKVGGRDYAEICGPRDLLSQPGEVSSLPGASMPLTSSEVIESLPLIFEAEGLTHASMVLCKTFKNIPCP